MITMVIYMTMRESTDPSGYEFHIDYIVKIIIQ